MQQTYSSPEEAARASKQNKAISFPPKYVETIHGRFPIQIAFSPTQGVWAVYYSSPGIKVHDVQVTKKDADAVQRWKPW